MASQSKVGQEMSNLIDSTLAKERAKNKRLRDQLSKAERKLKKQAVAEEDDDEEEGTEDASDPNSGWLLPGEIAIILDHMENSMSHLVGNGKSAQYKKDRRAAWDKLIDEINRWNEAQGTGKVRKYAKIKKKIDNIKKNGKDFRSLQGNSDEKNRNKMP